MKGVKRVQLDLPEKSMQRLQDLKEKTESSSYAEVIKNALRLYDAVIEEVESGNTFLVKDSSGLLKEYVVF
jgi:metal-responsive CopG/Arc/MetJ family transcriptional regulator